MAELSHGSSNNDTELLNSTLIFQLVAQLQQTTATTAASIDASQSHSLIATTDKLSLELWWRWISSIAILLEHSRESLYSSTTSCDSVATRFLFLELCQQLEDFTLLSPNYLNFCDNSTSNYPLRLFQSLSNLRRLDDQRSSNIWYFAADNIISQVSVEQTNKQTIKQSRK